MPLQKIGSILLFDGFIENSYRKKEGCSLHFYWHSTCPEINVDESYLMHSLIKNYFEIVLLQFLIMTEFFWVLIYIFHT